MRGFFFIFTLNFNKKNMKTKKSYLFRPPVTKVFNSKTYYITNGTTPFSNKKDALNKAERIRKDNRLCRVVAMNGEFYIYSRSK